MAGVLWIWIIFSVFQTPVDSVHKMAGNSRDTDLIDQLTEKPPYHKLTGFGFRDSPGLQIEQLFIIKPADRAGMACPYDIAVFNLQVRFRICNGTGDKDEIAVQLI